MASPVVRKTQLDRLGDWMQARGWAPAAIDALPGGLFRFHLTPPGAPSAATDEQESAAWDEALR